jgi:lysophospholipase L1-like esterase
VTIQGRSGIVAFEKIASMNRKRIMVFGDSNSWGFVPCAANELTTRYDATTRWPGVMAARLGSAVEVVEEALSARTTDLDDLQMDLPSAHLKGATFNGAKLLPAIVASHLPLDLVIIMLGTNDLKTRFKRSAQEIAVAALGLVKLIEECAGGVGTIYPAPKVLLVAPPPLGTGFHDPDHWVGSNEISLELGSAFRDAAIVRQLPFFDAGKVITTDGIDGVHFTSESHRKLGEAVAEKVFLLLQTE